MKTIILQIKVNQKDYNLLAKYGFCFEDNINEYLHGIAEEMRAEIDKQKTKKHAKA